MPLQIGDSSSAVKVTQALPGGATTVYTGGIDLGHGDHGDFVAQAELLIEAPALATGELPDAQTMIYAVQHSSDPTFQTGTTTLFAAAITQIGADSAGAAAQTKRLRLPTNVDRYIRVSATKSGAGSAATKSMTARMVF